MIAAGGTGGHVYPALATAEALLNAEDGDEAHQLHFLGAAGGMERALVARSGLAFKSYHEILAGPLHGVSRPRRFSSLLKLAIGSLQSLGLLLRLRPKVSLLTGGWANMPVALAAWLLRIPLVIYLPDIEPGLTIKALQPFASKIAITAAPSADFFPAGKSVVTGYPLGDNRLNARREDARRYFHLEANRQTLLVSGGSRGARSINIALAENLRKLLDLGIQIIHVTGEFDWAANGRRLGKLSEHPHYHAYAYLHDEMGLAFAGADLALCRAGASALAELPFFGLPSILVPYPHAWRYQAVNADYLAQRGAAVRLNDDELSDKLFATVSGLLSDARRLDEMRAKAQSLAHADGAARLASLLLEAGGG